MHGGFYNRRDDGASEKTAGEVQRQVGTNRSGGRKEQATVDGWEIGAVIDIVKKNGGQRSVEDTKLRTHLVEELADVLMYYNEVLLCYGITADELRQAYKEKVERNMTRW